MSKYSNSVPPASYSRRTWARCSSADHASLYRMEAHSTFYFPSEYLQFCKSSSILRNICSACHRGISRSCARPPSFAQVVVGKVLVCSACFSLLHEGTVRLVCRIFAYYPSLFGIFDAPDRTWFMRKLRDYVLVLMHNPAVYFIYAAQLSDSALVCGARQSPRYFTRHAVLFSSESFLLFSNIFEVQLFNLQMPNLAHLARPEDVNFFLAIQAQKLSLSRRPEFNTRRRTHHREARTPRG
ncbi:hypothetical protein DFH06DRAFT_767337 [Mycena polygramma]|nr:hypothetical protein DFH06DRAFT_767337 [Mycena polygramma]